jgi:CHAT domain-containing protein
MMLTLLLAAVLTTECPSPFGEQHRYVSCYEAMLAEGEAREDHALQGRALMQLAWAAWQKTEFEACRARFERAVAAFRKAGDVAGEARAANFLGFFLQTQLREHEAAAAQYQKALEMARRIGDRQLEGEVLYHLAFLSLVRRDAQKTIEFGEQALAAHRDAGDRRGEGVTLAVIGQAYKIIGKPAESIRYQEQALPLIQESGDRRSEADVLDRIGHALSDLRRFEDAIPYHQRALDLRRQLGDEFESTLSLMNLGAAYRASGRLLEAAETLQTVIAIVERARDNQASRRYRSTVLARKLVYYERYIDLLMAMGRDADALHVSERARARMTLDAIEQAQAAGGALDEARPLTAAEIQEQLLDDETMLLEYALGDERSFAWSVTRGSVTSRTLAKRETIEVAARRVHELLSAGDQRARRHELGQAIDALSDLVVGDVPKAVRRIVVVADGALQYIPFSALKLKGAPLIERYEIVTAPSASTVAAMRRLKKTTGPIAILADPAFGAEYARLPATRREAEAILRLAPRGSMHAFDSKARRDVLISGNLSRFGTIHFATHAIVDGDRAGIVLSEGVVSLQDLYRIRLDASLVVLSACRTALGRDLRGEGMVSLVRGFMHAGVPRVVATYWDVKDESTSELMLRFYRGMLVRGMTPAAALRSAQRSMQEEGPWRAPYYWAGFTLQGDWR